MKKQFLEAGQIVNTHGIRGEVRIQPWCDSADFLLDIDKFYLDGKAVKFTGKRVHKTMLIAKPEGVDNANDAALLKGKVLYFDRDDAQLEAGLVFIDDLIGLEAVNVETGEVFGKVTNVLKLPASDVYVIKGEGEYMIPAVDEFLKKTDLNENKIYFKLIEGMI
ncbi:MAG: 16S rRNA processing protein RimM [Ruminococcaceae bacterium]|nr:16S rRNA processing protein RimM [Oscillospiraceae bacterium]